MIVAINRKHFLVAGNKRCGTRGRGGIIKPSLLRAERAGRPAGKSERRSTASASDTRANTAPWPQRFGALRSVAVKNGRKGRYAIATVDRSKFEQVALGFGDELSNELS